MDDEDIIKKDIEVTIIQKYLNNKPHTFITTIFERNAKLCLTISKNDINYFTNLGMNVPFFSNTVICGPENIDNNKQYYISIYDSLEDIRNKSDIYKVSYKTFNPNSTIDEQKEYSMERNTKYNNSICDIFINNKELCVKNTLLKHKLVYKK